MKSFFCFTIVFACLAVGCKEEKKLSDEEQVLSDFQQLVDSIFADKQQIKPLGYIILPNSGCGGCISSAEQLFVKYGRESEEIKFIFTNINSVKNLRLTFGDTIISGRNVFLDKNNLFYSRLPKLVRVYPVLFYHSPQSGNLMYKYVSPENSNSIANFERYLAQKMPHGSANRSTNGKK